jgi:uncharacterized RDD family membrane protein YckC
MQWYYAINGQRQGPVTDAEFQALVQNGTIAADTLVWRQGMSNWQPYSQVAPTLSAAAPVAAAVAAGAPEGAAADDTAICAVSGKRYPKREMVEFEGKWISAEHRDTYFQRLREGAVAQGDFEYGGFWIRFCAKFIDGIVMFVVGMVVNVVFGVGFGSFQQSSDPNFFASFMIRQLLAILVGTMLRLAYYWFFLSRYSATPGKMVFGLKVVRSDGSALSTGRIIGRYFAEVVSSLILCIGYIMAAFDDEKRTLHDHMCDTRVIKTR